MTRGRVTAPCEAARGAGEVEPAAVPQADLADHRVPPALQRAESLVEAGGDLRLVPLLAEIERQQVGGVGIVFDDEDTRA